MSDEGQKFNLFKYRVQSELDHYDGNPPEIVVMMWAGYLAAIYEHDIISLEEYQLLNGMLPKLENDHLYWLFLGRHDNEEDES